MTTPEEREVMRRMGAKGGRKTALRQSPQERSERMRKASLIRWAKEKTKKEKITK